MDKPYKLLIIDDEAEILATFNNFFREKKYDVYLPQTDSTH